MRVVAGQWNDDGQRTFTGSFSKRELIQLLLARCSRDLHGVLVEGQIVLSTAVDFEALGVDEEAVRLEFHGVPLDLGAPN